MQRRVSRGIGACALGVVIVAASGVARADEQAGPRPQNNTFSVGALLGVFMPDAQHEFYDTGESFMPLNEAGVELGIRLSYLPLAFLGVEGEVDITPIGTDGGDGATLLGWRGQVIAQVPARLTPFVVAGAGTIGILSGSGSLGDDNDATAHVGLGAKLYLTSELSLRVDGRLIRAPKREPEPPRGDGTNHYAILLGAAWTFGGSAPSAPPPANPDPDGDSFVAEQDKCPYEAGAAPDGCPTLDKDSDGIFDSVDQCPDQPETENGVQDGDGCPDQDPDQDGDGFSDRVDTCPEQAEDVDGFEDKDGCPDPDNDKDGLADVGDSCPAESGPAENRGCPDTDKDGDGIVDRLDNCPDEAGTAANAGCKSKQLVQITDTQLKILDKVYFASDKDKVHKRSFKLLTNVAQVINAHPEIKKVRIEGHTDDRGDDNYNKELSQRRADSVVQFLIGKGVSVDRLEAVGFGEERPLAPNANARARAQNRRVEFNIVTDGPAAPAAQP